MSKKYSFRGKAPWAMHSEIRHSVINWLVELASYYGYSSATVQCAIMLADDVKLEVSDVEAHVFGFVCFNLIVKMKETLFLSPEYFVQGHLAWEKKILTACGGNLHYLPLGEGDEFTEFLAVEVLSDRRYRCLPFHKLVEGIRNFSLRLWEVYTDPVINFIYGACNAAMYTPYQANKTWKLKVSLPLVTGFTPLPLPPLERRILEKGVDPISLKGKVGVKIGSGSYATVYRVDEMAVKYCYRETATTPVDFLREIATLQYLSHPGIIKFLGWTKNNYIVLELMEMSVEGLIASGRIYDARDFCIQLARGLAYLHRLGIAHRDLSAGNVLIRGDELKIADFGSARVDKDQKFTSPLCHILYRPVECALGLYRSGMGIDVWAAGCIIYYLFNKKMPFLHPTPLTAALYKIGTPKPDDPPQIWAACKYYNLTSERKSRFAGSIWEHVFVYNPENRANASSLLAALEVGMPARAS